MLEKQTNDPITIEFLLGEDKDGDAPNQQQVTTIFQKSQDAARSVLNYSQFNMPPPSYRGKQIATQRQSQSDHHALPFQLKQAHEIISNPSGVPISDYRLDADSSKFSMKNTDYQASLIKWDQLVPDQIQSNIYQAIRSKMNEVTMIALFSSKRQTYLYAETPEGVKRDCFQYGQRKRGTGCIMKCEPPVPWSKTVDPYKLKKELTQFLRESYWSVQVKGSVNEAYGVIKELRQNQNDRKREDKELMKTVQVAQKQEDKMKAKNNLWESIKDRYLGVLIRQLVPPKEWIHAEFPINDEEQESEIVLKMMLESKLQLMNTYYKNACELMKPEQEFEYTAHTLKKYVDNYGSDEQMLDCVKSVNNAGHGRLLRAIYNILFGEKTKRRTVWITGVASSGKSMFIRRLRSIFASDEVDWRGVYLPVKKRYNENIKTQLVTCEEFSFKNAFSDANYHVTKMLFEGEGANVRKDLYASFMSSYEDAVFVVASNKLPGTEAQARDETFNQDIWGPIVSRVDFVYMTTKHEEKEVFPYTTVQLARALLFLTKNQDLISQMEDLDNSIIPEAEDSDIAQRQLAAQQQQRFSKLLKSKGQAEEILSQAQRDGNIQQPAKILSQQILGKNLKEDNDDRNSLLAYFKNENKRPRN